MLRSPRLHIEAGLRVDYMHDAMVVLRECGEVAGVTTRPRPDLEDHARLGGLNRPFEQPLPEREQVAQGRSVGSTTVALKIAKMLSSGKM
jgi:hypothetical protein